MLTRAESPADRHDLQRAVWAYQAVRRRFLAVFALVLVTWLAPGALASINSTFTVQELGQLFAVFLTLVAIAALLTAVWHLADAMGRSGAGWVIASAIPVVNVVFLVALGFLARRWLRERDVEVTLLGPSSTGVGPASR